MNTAVTFTPPSLEGEIQNAVAWLPDDVSLEVEGVEITRAMSSGDFDDGIGLDIDETTGISISIGRAEVDANIRELLDTVAELKGGTVSFDGLVYSSEKRTLLRVRADDAKTYTFVESVTDSEQLGVRTQQSFGKAEIGIGIRVRSLHFSLSVVIRKLFHDEYNMPASEDDVFIEAEHSGGCDVNVALGAIHAYMFEIHSLLGLTFSEAPRPVHVDDFPPDEEVHALRERASRMRPLLDAPGMYPILREFNRGVAAADAESATLSYVKCIEHVSATVVREKQYEDLRKRLMSPHALSPDASYMDGLLALFEENRQFTKDSEALRLTVERCCDAVLLSSYALRFLKALRSCTPTSKPDDRKQALAQFAVALSATRNQLAHAKANYEASGRECPADQLYEFSTCAKYAAEHCLRWYAAHAPALRRT